MAIGKSRRQFALEPLPKQNKPQTEQFAAIVWLENAFCSSIADGVSVGETFHPSHKPFSAQRRKNLSIKAGSFSLGSCVDFLAIGKSRGVYILKARVFESFCSLVGISFGRNSKVTGKPCIGRFSYRFSVRFSAIAKPKAFQSKKITNPATQTETRQKSQKGR